jgi:protein gp37
MNKTSIEWTHRPETGGESGGYTWNPIHAHSERLDHRGKLKTGNFCTKLSPGCANCYAAQLNIVRGNGLDYTYPNLEETPVAERFLSIEPQLEHVDIRQYLARRRIHLVIDGGESGHNARPFVLAWAESLLWQCRDAGVPFFMKQIGRKPQSKDLLYLFKATPLKDAKGGDPMEWPESLRVRQFPTVRKAPEHGNI